MTKSIHLFILPFLLFLVSCSGAETDNNENLSYEEVIKKDILQFMETHMNNGEWGDVIDMMYPKLFELVSKDQLVDQMTQMEASGIKMTANNTKVVNISKPSLFKGEQFCLVNYTSDIQITIKESIADMSSVFQTQFEQAYGEGNVIFDSEHNVFDIKSEKAMIAVATQNENNWAYFEYNETQPEMLNFLLPEEVKRELI